MRTREQWLELQGDAGFARRAVALPLGLVEALLRTLGSGLLFAVFGIGGLVLALVVIPLRLRRVVDRESREIEAQRLIQRSFDRFIRIGCALHILSISESGTARLQHGAGLVVANHPTLLDIVFLVSRMPQADCIVKQEAWRNPFLRFIVTAAGYIPNDIGEALIGACSDRLRAGRALILFPEGSRSPESGLGKFQRGAAHVALASACPITPVLIRCDPPALMKGQAWYALPKRKLAFSLRVGDSFHAEDLIRGDVSRPVAARQVTEALRAYFETRLGDGIA